MPPPALTSHAPRRVRHGAPDADQARAAVVATRARALAAAATTLLVAPDLMMRHVLEPLDAAAAAAMGGGAPAAAHLQYVGRMTGLTPEQVGACGPARLGRTVRVRLAARAVSSARCKSPCPRSRAPTRCQCAPHAPKRPAPCTHLPCPQEAVAGHIFASFARRRAAGAARRAAALAACEAPGALAAGVLRELDAARAALRFNACVHMLAFLDSVLSPEQFASYCLAAWPYVLRPFDVKAIIDGLAAARAGAGAAAGAEAAAGARGAAGAEPSSAGGGRT